MGLSTQTECPLFGIMANIRLPRLVGDASLGKLVAYLRLAGIDTLFDPAVPDPNRLSRLAQGERTILTRCLRVQKEMRSRELIFIIHDQPVDQVRQVVAALKLRSSDLKPLTRCSRCNRLLVQVPRDQVVGSVPEYIATVHRTFHKCATCNNVFWSGSHAMRWLKQLNQWFKVQD